MRVFWQTDFTQRPGRPLHPLRHIVAFGERQGDQAVTNVLLMEWEQLGMAARPGTGWWPLAMPLTGWSPVPTSSRPCSAWQTGTLTAGLLCAARSAGLYRGRRASGQAAHAKRHQ